MLYIFSIIKKSILPSHIIQHNLDNYQRKLIFLEFFSISNLKIPKSKQREFIESCACRVILILNQAAQSALLNLPKDEHSFSPLTLNYHLELWYFGRSARMKGKSWKCSSTFTWPHLTPACEQDTHQNKSC